MPLASRLVIRFPYRYEISPTTATTNATCTATLTTRTSRHTGGRDELGGGPESGSASTTDMDLLPEPRGYLHPVTTTDPRADAGRCLRRPGRTQTCGVEMSEGSDV